MKYYRDSNKRLWKIENDEYFYFSQKTMNWKKCSIFFVELAFADAFEITGEQVKNELKDLKRIDYDDLPFFYFSDDNENIFAMDANGMEYYFNEKENKLIEQKNCIKIKCMESGWGSVSEEYAKKRMAEIAAV